MNLFTLIRRNARFHARAHCGLLLCAIAGSAALAGALLVGDSVRLSLRDLALARLGRVEIALSANDRFFRTTLAENFSETNQPAVAVLQLPGMASTPDESARANQVQVIGVPATFWSLAPERDCFNAVPADGAVVSEALAHQLGVQTGDFIIVRVHKPSLISRDALISPQDDLSVALRLNIDAVATNSQLARFGLQPSQVAPLNVFVDLKRLQELTGQTNRANLLLSTATNALAANQKLQQSWQLADAQLSLRSLPDKSGTELRSDRIFIDPIVEKAAKEISPAVQPIETYFVNELRSGPYVTPYSMACAAGPPLVPADLRDDEIIVTDWLAQDLAGKPGDPLTLTYYTISTGRALQEASRTFHIRSVVPMNGAYADPGLMPEFPGIAEAEKQSEWDAGIPLKLDRIRPKDEQYWKEHRGTPKAFVTLAAGRQMWTNRFGDATALRFPLTAGTAKELQQKLTAKISPADVGLSFQPVREQALAASAQAVDFGGLFLGFSLFLIMAALLLMALLFQFNLERRMTEIGTLLALGFQPRQLRRLYLGEGMIIALLGGIIGTALGTLYARVMVAGLTTVWRGAVGTSALSYHATSDSLIFGALASLIVSAITLWFALRKQFRRTARELLAGLEPAPRHPRKRSLGLWLGSISLLGALVLLGVAFRSTASENSETFFDAGGLLLISGLGFAAVWLFRLARPNSPSHAFGLFRLALRGCGRRGSRSLATIGLLSCGVFLIVAIGAFRLDARTASNDRSSSTGGFRFIADSTLPVTHNLNTHEGRAAYDLDDAITQRARFISFRQHDGDEASCLNLNHAPQPRLLGVDPASLSERQAFTFAEQQRGFTNGWLNLRETNSLAADEVPAIGDENSILWSMGKKVGDTIPYTDAQGRTFKVRIVGALANSILQGSLIIDETQFLKRFPNESGYRFFLIDFSGTNNSEFASHVTQGLQRLGFELTPATDRLNSFNAVQNTYLSTFQILGGLGLLLGSAGLGVVVLRNVQERRAEFGLLAATGYARRTLQWLVLGEHAALLGVGVAVGAIAAAIAVLPALLAPGAHIPYLALALTVMAVWVNGMVWTWFATRLALRGKLTAALRSE